MYSTLCRLAMINSEERHNERDIRWILKLESKTSNRIGYRVYVQTIILSTPNTLKLLDLALLNCNEEYIRRTKMILELNHKGFCRIYGLQLDPLPPFLSFDD